MPVDKNRIHMYRTGKTKFVTAKDVDKVNMELLLTLDETADLVQLSKCKDAVPYILWNDFVNRYGTLAPKTAKSYNRYVWGQKVFVDFGMHNIQTELSYPHPAILLYNLANTAIVVPKTTDDKATSFTRDIEESIIKVKSDGSIFPNDTIINLHQICAVHKERILNDLKCNVKNFIVDEAEIGRLNSYEQFCFFSKGMNLLDCIRIKITSIFNREYINNMFIREAYDYNDTIQYKKTIHALQEQIKELENKIVTLQKIIDN